MEIVGWIGSILFAVCGIPQAVKSYKEKHSDGVSLSFILLWLFGEIFSLIYVMGKDLPPILCNYVVNLVCIFIILRYKFKNG